MSKLRVDIWSDIACPWCYIGKRHLEAALERFPAREAVEVVWRAFELDPTAPRVRDLNVSQAERLAKKYGMSTAQAEGRLRQMVEVAKKDGLDFRFDHMKSGNTFDAHRLIHFAQQSGRQDAMKERLLRAYMTEGEAIGEQAVLERLAVEVGIEQKDARNVLESDACAAEVRADEQEAHDLQITGVPFFVLGGRYGISGAQPAEVILSALNQAWTELGLANQAEASFPEGAVCGPDGCA